MWQEIHDKDHWNNLAVRRIEHAPFLQSWQWGEFQESLGREARRLSWRDKIIVQAIKMPLPLGKSYWYVPRGPIVIPAAFSPDVHREGIQFVQNEVFMELERIFTGRGLFLRMDPVLQIPPCPRGPQKLTSGARNFWGGVEGGKGGWERRPRCIPSVQAQCVRILDIRKSADDLLAAMHPKTRYNINLAQKKGVIVGPGNIDDFLRLNRATHARDKFKSHPDYYYQKMNETLGGDFLKIWQAACQNKILASAIIVYFGDTATYVHGASSDERRELMSPHLLHWKITQDAQERGYHYYDLGGVKPEDKNHPAYKKTWEGISRFKAGFGGEIICYPESFDLIYQPNWYRLYWLAKKFL